MKKLLCLSLALLLLSSLLLLASCGEEKTPEEATTAVTTEETTTGITYLDKLPDGLDFKNEEISFLVAAPTEFNTRGIKIDNYVLGSNSVDNAVFTRNTLTEERLGVVLSLTAIDGSKSMISTSAYVNDLNSGTSTYDILSGWMSYDTSMAIKGVVLDLKSLKKYDADYLNLKAKYWSPSFNKAIAYRGVQYWASGDLALTYLSGMFPCFVNTRIYEDTLAATYGPIYDLVNEKAWTMEKMMEMAAIAFSDEGTIPEKPDPADRLGFVSNYYDEFYGFLYGAGVKVSDLDAGGNPLIVFNDDDNAFNFMTLINRMFKSNYTLFTDASVGGGLFAQDNVLFSVTKLQYAETQFKNLESYGIIPVPMLDATIGKYNTATTGHLNTFGIYSGCSHIPAAAATLEALAAESMRSVTPAYYDEALKYRYTRDPESAQMVDLIHDSIYIDFAFAWRNVVGGTSNFFTDEFMRANYATGATASSIKTAAELWQNNLEGLLEELASASSK